MSDPDPTREQHRPATIQATTPSTVHGSLTIRTDEPIDPAKEWPGPEPAAKEPPRHDCKARGCIR